MNEKEIDFQEYEMNQVSWWMDWAEIKWIEQKRAYMIRSEDFREPLFNHLGFLSVPDNFENMEDIAREYFEGIKINPSVFVPSLKEYSFVANSLKSKGYASVDTMLVMELKEPKMNINREVEVNAISARGAMEWVRVYLQSFYYEGFYRERVYSAVRKAIERKDVKLLLARVKGLPVGCTALHLNDNIAGAYCVGVIPEYRNRHVASTLLSVASGQDMIEGRKLTLQTFKSDRLEEWYKKLGFSVVYSKDIFTRFLYKDTDEHHIQQGIVQESTQKELDVLIERNLEVDRYIFADVFKGFENVPALVSVFGDKLAAILKSTYVVVDPRDGYLHVDNEKGWIYISQPYLKKADIRYLYLDLIHELVHVKQFHEGKDLYDWSYPYFERPTEVEAYRVTINEARRIGMSDDEIADYLKVEWVEEDEYRNFLKRMKIKTKI